jgi:hypothetical protein
MCKFQWINALHFFIENEYVHFDTSLVYFEHI